MKFKEKIDEYQWNNPPAIGYNITANEKLKRLVGFIDSFCVLMGYGEIVVTDYYRQGKPNSYHYILQAVDIRTHDKPPIFKAFMIVIEKILKVSDLTLQIYTHPEIWGTPGEHIHVAIKDGSLKRT